MLRIEVILVVFAAFVVDAYAVNLSLREDHTVGTCGDNCQVLFNPGLNMLTIRAQGGERASIKDYSWTGDDVPPWGKDMEYNGEVIGTVNDITEVTIESGIKSIGKKAFRDMLYINSVTIGGTVMTIDEFAFSGCTGLGEIKYDTEEPNLEKIGDKAFYRTGLTVVAIPNRVKTVGLSAFACNEELYCVTLGVTSCDLSTLGGYAFKDCPKLHSVSFNGKKDLGTGNGKTDPFRNTAVKEINVPKSYGSKTFVGYDVKKTNNLKCGTSAEERYQWVKNIINDVITMAERVISLAGGIAGTVLAVIDLVIIIIKLRS